MSSRSRLTRREFVQRAGGALAGVPLLMSRASGETTRPAPSERLTVGFIGTGKFGNAYHLRDLLRFPDVQAVAVCDVDTNRREQARERVNRAYSGRRGYSGCAAYRDFRELLARTDIDAVVIATPEHWHTIMVVEACKAGKDVYCEKPLTLTLAESQRCIEAVRKYNRVMQVGSQQRSNIFGQFREACEFIRSGRLGRIRRVEVGVGGPSKPCDLPGERPEPGLDWDLWLGPALERPYSSVLSPRGVHDHFPSWREYREYAGGALADMGAHHFDIAQWALDMDRSGPVKIIPPEDPKVTRGAKMIYANGIELVHGGESGCTFYGEKGKLRIDRGVLQADPADLIREPVRADEVHLRQTAGHHRDWVDCIRSRRDPIADVEAGARTAAICILLNLVYWKRRELRWDPANWRFVDDAEANAWLDRPRREAWPLPTI
jgi:predicted dehydrogenase